MANVRATSLFSNPLLSDCTIRQSCDGVTREYHAHKAILCSGSEWFVRALTGNFQEADSGIVNLHDDDPIYFEVLLRFLYEHNWHEATAAKKKHNLLFPMSSMILTAIGVYGLADKYEVDTLRVCALGQIPSPSLTANPYFSGTAKLDDVSNIVKAHYSQCVRGNCAMGRKICLSIIKWMPEIAKSNVFALRAEKYPALAIDMYFAGRDNHGKLWETRQETSGSFREDLERMRQTRTFHGANH